jgi:hypothetical protein
MSAEVDEAVTDHETLLPAPTLPPGTGRFDRMPEAVTSDVPRRRTDGATGLLILAALAAVVAALGPIVVAGVDGWGRAWFPPGDWAMLELRVLDVGGSDPPLVGPYSRYGWNHPGPLLFWVLALPYHLTGRQPWALLVAAAGINAVALGATLWLVWRRGGPLLVALASAVLVLVTSTIGVEYLRDPWNPWVTVLPFALFVVAVWSTLDGDGWGPPLVAVVGSFLVQAHVGFAPLVAAGVLLALAGWLVGRRPRRSLVVAAALLAGCWTPVALDALVGSGNLQALAAYFTDDRDGVGLSTAVGIAALELDPLGPWAGAEEPIDGGSVVPAGPLGLLVPVAALALAGVLAWVSGAREVLRLQLTVAVMAVAGVLSVSRISEQVFDYLIRWWWVLAALWWLSVLWAVARAAAKVPAPAGAPARRWMGPGAAAVVAGALVLASVDLTRQVDAASVPIADWHDPLEAVTAPTRAALDRDAPVFLERRGPLSGWVTDAMAVDLARAGFEIVVADEGINARKFGATRLEDPEDEPRPQRIVVATGHEAVTLTAAGGVHRLVALYPGSGEEHPPPVGVFLGAAVPAGPTPSP